MSKQIPFRYDFVGSFLRPANLKAAREGFENGKISADELKAVEDREIERLINKQNTGFNATVRVENTGRQ
jgi:5-methyltetrahydropteroyltriglutamate--homocysteine methyltransferase